MKRSICHPMWMMALMPLMVAAADTASIDINYGYLLRQMYDAVDGRRPALPRLHSQGIAPLDFQQVLAISDFLSRLGLPVGEATDARSPSAAPAE